MGLGDFFFGSDDENAYTGSSSGYSGTSPATPITISAGGKNSVINPTVNNVATSNVDGSENEGYVFSNVNVGGGLTFVTSDAGALDLAGQIADGGFDLSRRAIEGVSDAYSESGQLIKGAVGGALAFADTQSGRLLETTRGALEFADRAETRAYQFTAGLSQGYAESLADLQTYNNQAHIEELGIIRDSASNTSRALAGVVSDFAGRISAQQNNSLEFFASQTQNLQRSTLNAIDVAAQATQSEDALAFNELQKTLVKLAIGIGVLFFGSVYLLKARA
jgi:hypothetical protein